MLERDSKALNLAPGRITQSTTATAKGGAAVVVLSKALLVRENKQKSKAPRFAP